jgi:hypothetical protein
MQQVRRRRMEPHCDDVDEHFNYRFMCVPI